MHAWPCNPAHQNLVQLAEAPWTELTRCLRCGSLWESMDRGWRRLTVARARDVFGVEVAPFMRPELGGPHSVLGVHLALNEGALFRIVVVTDAGHWQVGERGALMWMLWTGVVGELETATLERAVELAGQNWGVPAAAALRLALDSGFDPWQLGALDLAQALPRDDWEHPWQARTVEVVNAMFTAGSISSARVDAALGVARGAGLTQEDFRIGGFGAAGEDRSPW